MVDINQQLNGLLYKNGDRFYPLPKWCKFYISFGQHINDFISTENKLVVAITVPSRAYCSALISLGFITARVDLFDEMDINVQSDYIKSLPDGTPVVFRSQTGKRFKGRYRGFIKIKEQTYFRIQTDERNSTEYNVPSEKSVNIEVLDEDFIALPQTQKGRSIFTSSEFAVDILGSKLAFSLVCTTKLEQVIIGPKKDLKREIAEENFYSQKKTRRNLQEILRTREFQSSTAAFRSIVISDRIKFSPIHSNIPDPSLTIFDGCQGYLKWRNFWKGSNWVVILDRTEYQYDPAIEQLTREYIKNRVDKPRKFSLSNIPIGIEIMVFEVSR